MLRRNRADTFLEIGRTTTSRIKFLHARSCHSASGASRAELICWTHFCSFPFPRRRRHYEAPGSPSFCRTVFFSGPTFARSPCRAVTGTPEAALFLRADPVFLIPFGAPPARSHDSCDGPTFTHSVWLMKIPSLHAFNFTGKFNALRDTGIQEARQKGGFVFGLVHPTS